MTCKVAFIGLGVMGYPMAGYISKAGHDVTVYNRTKSKAEKWIKEYKGKLANTPMEAAKDSEFILPVLVTYLFVIYSWRSVWQGIAMIVIIFLPFVVLNTIKQIKLSLIHI